MLNPLDAGTTTRAQIAETDQAVLRFAIVARRPDEDVHPGDRVWWLAREERLEIHDELAASGLL